MKKNELSNHEKTWRNLKCILMSQRNQSEKAERFQLHEIFGTDKTIKTVRRSLPAKGFREKRCGINCLNTDFQGSDTILYGNYSGGYISLFFFQIHYISTTQRVKVNVKY